MSHHIKSPVLDKWTAHPAVDGGCAVLHLTTLDTDALRLPNSRLIKIARKTKTRRRRVTCHLKNNWPQFHPPGPYARYSGHVATPKPCWHGASARRAQPATGQGHSPFPGEHFAALRKQQSNRAKIVQNQPQTRAGIGFQSFFYYAAHCVTLRNTTAFFVRCMRQSALNTSLQMRQDATECTHD